MRLEGESIMTDSEHGHALYSGHPNQALSGTSSGTVRQVRSPTILVSPCQPGVVRERQGSTTSMSSSNLSVASSSSTTSHTSTTRSVSVGGGPNLAGTGTLHCRPMEPLLVFFTHTRESNQYGIVGVRLGQSTGVNFRPCECLTKANECTDAMIEPGQGEKYLDVLRLGNGSQWDMLPLAESLHSRRANKDTGIGKVIRVTIRFPTVDQRAQFGGRPCNCSVATEGELMKCLQQLPSHRGKLGLVKEVYRRELNKWSTMRYDNQRHVVNDRRQ
jgi:hypothetical protein